ncbi:MAG: hypothetical protein ABUT39_22520 [Acidobacteriota bacterium]
MKDERPESAKETEGSNAILAQYHAAEYSALMGRVSSWENLQYAAWPILIAALALLAQMENIDEKYRWWAALLSALVVYVAYQGTMVNMLYYVLVIERDIRPLAGQLVGNENFWIHERLRHRHKNFPSNPGWSTKWPVIVSFLAITLTVAGIAHEYSTHWQDGACLAAALILGRMVARLTKNGERLKKQIKEACIPEVKLANRADIGGVGAPAT